ncbi:MAG: sugar nucleotide-binding protein [Pseudohongiellaceae bacterium]
MKLLIVGAGTPVGKELITLLRQRKITFHSLNERQNNLDNPVLIGQAVSRTAPDQVINLTSFRVQSQQAVMLAERHQEECRLLNFRLPRTLAVVCRDQGIPLLQLSSPYVFDGEKKLGYNEQDEPMPQGIYGRTALQAEVELQKIERHIIIRSGWLFGPGMNEQIKGWIKATKKHRGDLKVVRRRFSPTATEDLARVLLAVSQQVDCQASVWGVYHYCGLETKKEIEFVLQVLKYASQHDEQVYQLIDTLKITETSLSPPEIPNATLSSKKLFDTFGIKQRSWHGSLQTAIKSMYQSRGEARSETGDTSTRSTALQSTRNPH